VRLEAGIVAFLGITAIERCNGWGSSGRTANGELHISVPYRSSKVVSDAEDALTGGTALAYLHIDNTRDELGIYDTPVRDMPILSALFPQCVVARRWRMWGDPLRHRDGQPAVLRQGRGCLPAVVADVGHATPDPGTVLYLAVGGSGWRCVASAGKAVEGPTRRQTKRRLPGPRAYGGADGAPGRLTSPFVSCLSSALAQRWVG
jgi:hypothetical protein